MSNYIVLPDEHWPNHDYKSLDAVYKYMAAHRWDGVIQLGDFGSYDCVSSWVSGLPGLTERRAQEKDYEVGRAVLREHLDAGRRKNPKAEFVFLEGNHEYRVTRFLNRFPFLRGSLEVSRGLELQKHNVKYVELFSKHAPPYKIGHAYFHHGLYVTKFHASRHVDYFGKNIFYGHVHDVQSYSKVNHGDDSTLVGQSLGCLCEYDQEYLEGPTNWQQAFGVFHFQPSGMFNYFVVRIFDHQFIGPDGALYQPDKSLRRPKFLV